ncbi:MAG: cytochrome c biogenesis protein [Pelosinus sp.]|nr:cytochrome c biogenesis protein [Pelosinus sp.]
MRITGLTLGFLGALYAVFYIVPPAEGLGNLVRIAFFHIPVAWVSVLAFLLSAYWGGQYLRKHEMSYDWKSSAAAVLGLVFCLLATISGAVFAKLTWGAYWNWDPRQTTIFILLLIYGAYMALRSAVSDEEDRAKISAVYGLLSFLTVPFLVFIIPRFYFSLHPEPVINGSGKLGMDGTMTAVLIFTLGITTAIFWQLLSYLIDRKQRDYQLESYDKE